MSTVMVEIPVDEVTAQALSLAAALGLTDQDIDDELAVWKAERAAETD